MSDEEMEQLLARMERDLGSSWTDVVDQLRADNPLEDVEARLVSGSASAAIEGVEDAAATFATDVHAAYVDAGQGAAESLDVQLDAVVRFDATKDRAVAWAQRNKADLVREVTAEQRDVIRQVVTDGVRAGRNPRDVARELRGSIGLTQYQADVVTNYRRLLESGDLSSALERELRDGRYDRSLAAAIRDGRALPQDRIDTMVERYRQNWVDFRAETIARTEGLRALHEGTEETFRQAIEAGDVEADQLVREWHHANVGKNPRPGHLAMNGQRRKWGESFLTGDGYALKYPGDPDADPSQTVCCRCVVSTVLA